MPASKTSRVLTPAVLLPDLGLLLGSEIIHDIELLADLLRVLALNHGGHLCTREVQQALDVEVVRSEDEFKENFLLNVAVLRVPLRDTTLQQVGALQGLLDLLWRVVLVVLAVVNDLAQ